MELQFAVADVVENYPEAVAKARVLADLASWVFQALSLRVLRLVDFQAAFLDPFQGLREVLLDPVRDPELLVAHLQETKGKQTHIF